MTALDDGGVQDVGPVAVASLIELATIAGRDGAIWSDSTNDLNVNLVVLSAAKLVGEHTNREVDVLFVGIDGEGVVTVDGRETRLSAGGLIIVPKGSSRAVRPGSERFVYITCHRRRAGLWPSSRS